MVRSEGSHSVLLTVHQDCPSIISPEEHDKGNVKNQSHYHRSSRGQGGWDSPLTSLFLRAWLMVKWWGEGQVSKVDFTDVPQCWSIRLASEVRLLVHLEMTPLCHTRPPTKQADMSWCSSSHRLAWHKLPEACGGRRCTKAAPVSPSQVVRRGSTKGREGGWRGTDVFFLSLSVRKTWGQDINHIHPILTASVTQAWVSPPPDKSYSNVIKVIWKISVISILDWIKQVVYILAFVLYIACTNPPGSVSSVHGPGCNHE